MASTYSTNLRLELIGTGEQQGTWGVTTNSNLGTLLEQAIGGYVSVPVTDGADTTLTVSNGASDQSRNMTINLTGALTAARNVICPAIQKLYVVKNATTGGFAVTFKVSGQTGVTIPSGATCLIYVNGTDAVNAGGQNTQGYRTIVSSASPVSLTASDPALIFVTGSTAQTINLPDVTTLIAGWTFTIVNISTQGITIQSSGGNAFGTTQTAGIHATYTCIATTGTTTTSWNQRFVGATARTGTGNMVFSSGPTLTTPNLGVANATSYNKVAITAPATSATLTIADGKTLTASNTLTLAGTDSTVMTFPTANATVLTDSNSATLSKGFLVTPASLGTGNGAITLAAANGNYQSITNNGNAITINPPAADSAIDLLVINGTAPGSVTMSSTFKTAGSGASGSTYAATANTWWTLSVRRISGISTFVWSGPWT